MLVDKIPATSGNHNAGDLQFGKDGYLYVSVGDGGCDYAGDSGCAGQNDASRDQHVLVGKILRITQHRRDPGRTIRSRAPAPRAATSPAGRPPATKCQETFAWGLRNPFRFAFDPNAAGTRFYINDVGQATWEEIDLGQAGADYGWNVREGPCANGSETDCGPPPAGMTNPIYAYSHGDRLRGDHRRRVRPERRLAGAYDGAYLFGDYTCGKIFQLVAERQRRLHAHGVRDGRRRGRQHRPSGRRRNGQALYYTNYSNGGEVRRIEPTVVANRPPTARIDRHAQLGRDCRWRSASTAARAPTRMRATR